MENYKLSTDFTLYDELIEVQKTVCTYYGIPFINVYEESGINPFNLLTYYNDNNVHPKTIGFEQWGKTIARLI